MSSNTNGILGTIAVTWAVVGWGGTLAFAIGRLSLIAAEGLAEGLTLLQAVLLALNTAALGWSEGYRGFQVKFSPRAAARVLYLRDHATLASTLLAPAFCVGLYGATPRLRRLSWLGAALIVLVVLLVHRLPQPWRGIVDVGVVLGLGWGLVSFLLMTARALSTGTYPVPPEVRSSGAGSLRQPGL